MSFPVVALDYIPTPGLQVEVADWACAGVAEGLGGSSGTVSGQVHVTRRGRHVVVRGALEGAATTACDRCGEDLRLLVSGDVDCVYVPVDELAARSEEEPEDDGPDQGEYDGVALDLVHVVREFFALERPPRLLCADLDQAADAACLARFRAKANLGPSEPDPRFAALKGVKPTR